MDDVRRVDQGNPKDALWAIDQGQSSPLREIIVR